jgi:hypothetical protein
VQLSDPFLSGTPTDAYAANGDPGQWSGTGVAETTRWQRCDASGSNCVDIVDAVGASYHPTDADWHHTLRIKVVATGPDATLAPVFSAAYPVTPSQPPVSLSAPTVSGTARVGQPLTGTAGTWQVAFTGATVSTSSRWVQCNAPGVRCDVVVAVGSTFTPTQPGVYAYEEVAINEFGARRMNISRSVPIVVTS